MTNEIQQMIKIEHAILKIDMHLLSLELMIANAKDAAKALRSDPAKYAKWLAMAECYAHEKVTLQKLHQILKGANSG